MCFRDVKDDLLSGPESGPVGALRLTPYMRQPRSDNARRWRIEPHIAMVKYIKGHFYSPLATSSFKMTDSALAWLISVLAKQSLRQ